MDSLANFLSRGAPLKCKDTGKIYVQLQFLSTDIYLAVSADDTVPCPVMMIRAEPLEDKELEDYLKFNAEMVKKQEEENKE